MTNNTYAADNWHVSRNQATATHIESWEEERVKIILRATGRLIDFDVSDIPQEELREKFEIIARSRRMREADFSITQENLSSARRTGKGLIWDEVMK